MLPLAYSLSGVDETAHNSLIVAEEEEASRGDHGDGSSESLSSNGIASENGQLPNHRG